MPHSKSATLSEQEWLNDNATRRVVDALNTEPHAARFVGGCVRDAIRGEDVKDIDLATVHQPERVIELLEHAGLKAVPTGLGHGTITAVADGRPFEVTTLRTDVETFGRHAEVAFTNDWRADAERRDFTMNAIYADPDGRIFDPVDGVDDARNGLVRFIGDPDQRIQEDYLRILRFFRFNARFGHDELDAKGLAACVRNKSGLRRLSGERIQSELFQLLVAEAAAPIVRELQTSGILAEILPEGQASKLDFFDRTVSLDTRYSMMPDAVLRLAILLPQEEGVMKELAQRLKFSNDVKDRLLQSARAADVDVDQWDDEPSMRRILYRLGQATALDVLRLKWSQDATDARAPRWQSFVERTKAWSKPSLKVKAKDVMSLGIKEGPDVGKILAQVETWWIEQDFPNDRPLQLEQLKKIVRG